MEMYNKRIVRTFLSAFFLVLSFSISGYAQTGDTALIPAESKIILNKITAAHGGMKGWDKVKTVSFRYSLWVDFMQEWFDSYEMTDKNTLRSYQDLYLPEKGKISFNGKDVWYEGISGKGEPPRSRINFHYETITLPWTMQEYAISVSEPGSGKLPEDSADYITLNVEMPCVAGCTTNGHSASYKIFIDPKTYLIKGIQYYITYGAMLDVMNIPADQKSFGPMTHVYRQYMAIDGLVVPNTYDTYTPQGKSAVHHLVTNFSWQKPFDEKRMNKPATAILDTSKPERANN